MLHRRPIRLIVDGTGLQIVGEGPWSEVKRGTREWRKPHVGVNGKGFIVAHSMTESKEDDASVAAELLDQVSDRI